MIVALKRKFPLSDVVMTKRDIKSALRLIRIHPHLSRVMATEFSGHHFGLKEDVIVFYGVLPFGWRGSPSRFCRFSDDISILHQLHGPNQPMWHMGTAFRSKMYIDDGLFIELDMGTRITQSTSKWEEIAQGCLSGEAVNEEKNRLEGQWSSPQIFLGFEIDTSSLPIRLPEQKRAGSSVLFDEVFSDFGSDSMRLLALQQVRGNVGYG